MALPPAGAPVEIGNVIKFISKKEEGAFTMTPDMIVYLEDLADRVKLQLVKSLLIEDPKKTINVSNLEKRVAQLQKGAAAAQSS